MNVEFSDPSNVLRSTESAGLKNPHSHHQDAHSETISTSIRNNYVGLQSQSDASTTPTAITRRSSREVLAQEVMIEVTGTIDLECKRNTKTSAIEPVTFSVILAAHDARTKRILLKNVRGKARHHLQMEHGPHATLTGAGWVKLYRADGTVALADTPVEQPRTQYKARKPPTERRLSASSQQRQEIDRLMASFQGISLTAKTSVEDGPKIIGKRKRGENEDDDGDEVAEQQALKVDAVSMGAMEVDIEVENEASSKRGKMGDQQYSEELPVASKLILETGFIPLRNGQDLVYEEWHRRNTDGRSSVVKIEMHLMARLKGESVMVGR